MDLRGFFAIAGKEEEVAVVGDIVRIKHICICL